ncbi:hypothetical protein SAMD00023353_1201590 [Rosellinia necatrix]|uniref:DUF6594 domain-containing protein n=1 Tax=Rosellinia necatrix TaxID=77044 RepID=A0A1S8A6M2_ROSNE|nr:hypothetical protein SAMD00023353_1201590 [Rosellinia necatrix]
MSQANDIETGQRPTEYLEGYADFSKLIGSEPELSVYRRFDALRARNLLCLQRELQALEALLQSFDDDDQADLIASSGSREHNTLCSAKLWEVFCRLAEDDGAQKQKMALILRIQKALLRRSRILALETPPRDTLAWLCNWFRYRRPFLGSARHLMDDEAEPFTLKTAANTDRMAGLIRRFFGKDNLPNKKDGFHFPQRSITHQPLLKQWQEFYISTNIIIGVVIDTKLIYVF